MKSSNPYPHLRRHQSKYRLAAQDPSSWSLVERASESARRRIGGRKRARRAREFFDKVKDLAPAPATPSEPGPRPQMLLCSAHLDMAMISAKSLMLVAGRPLPFIFHDDGSLGPKDVQTLANEFPGSQILTRAEAKSVFLALMATQ